MIPAPGLDPAPATIRQRLQAALHRLGSVYQQHALRPKLSTHIGPSRQQRLAQRLAPLRVAITAQTARLRPTLQAFDARDLRERVLLIMASIAVLVMLFDAVGIQPARRAWSQARQQREAAQLALETLRGTVSSLDVKNQQQHQQMQAELVQLRERYQALSAASTARLAQEAANPSLRGRNPLPRTNKAGTAFNRSAGGLVAASDMLPLLSKLMRSQPGLRVRSLQSLGHTSLGTVPIAQLPGAAAAGSSSAKAASATATSASVASDRAAGPPTIYRHGVELTLEGSYADLVAYLVAVEALPQRIMWGSLQLKVDEHPRVQMTLRLYTLSMDTRWVEI